MSEEDPGTARQGYVVHTAIDRALRQACIPHGNFTAAVEMDDLAAVLGRWSFAASVRNTFSRKSISYTMRRERVLLGELAWHASADDRRSY